MERQFWRQFLSTTWATIKAAIFGVKRNVAGDGRRAGGVFSPSRRIAGGSGGSSPRGSREVMHVTRTVADATFRVAREMGLTTWFGNPGSTEIPLLADLPSDLRYVLALHENAAVGMAAGHALATGRPALVSLHTAAGLGNAVNALASARVSRAPLVVLVGQQDRRHIAFEPFL